MVFGLFEVMLTPLGLLVGKLALHNGDFTCVKFINMKLSSPKTDGNCSQIERVTAGLSLCYDVIFDHAVKLPNFTSVLLSYFLEGVAGFCCCLK